MAEVAEKYNPTVAWKDWYLGKIRFARSASLSNQKRLVNSLSVLALLLIGPVVLVLLFGIVPDYYQDVEDASFLFFGALDLMMFFGLLVLCAWLSGILTRGLTWLRCSLYIVTAFLLWQLNGWAWFSIDQSKIGFYLHFLAMLLVYLSMYLVAAFQMSFFDRARTNGSLIQIKSDEALDLHKVVNDLADRASSELGLDRVPIELWYSRTNEILPRTYASDLCSADVILPRGFFPLLKREPRSAEVLIAHELGHILQEDSEIWLKIDVVGSVIEKLGLPFLTLALALAITNILLSGESSANAVSASSMNTIRMIATYLIAVLGVLRSLKGSRFESEYLADCLASFLVDEASVIEILKKYAKGYSPAHPSAEQRVKRCRADSPRFNIDGKLNRPEENAQGLGVGASAR
jgi:hypothetical protein